jgi:hypothetical protein
MFYLIPSRMSVHTYTTPLRSGNPGIAGEGSTNWSTSGEGVFVVTGQAGGPGYKAQNNAQSIIMDPDTISCLTAELIAEHMAAQAQATQPKPAPKPKPKPQSHR